MLKKIESSEEYSKWVKSNPNFFFVHFFTMFEKNEDPEWQAGFYNKEKKKMVVFFLRNQIAVSEESDVLQTEQGVSSLSLKGITISFDKAITLSEEVCKKKYPTELIYKNIVLLQNLGGSAVWNITFVMRSFNTFNIRIDASTGEILKDSFAKLFGPLDDE